MINLRLTSSLHFIFGAFGLLFLNADVSLSNEMVLADLQDAHQNRGEVYGNGHFLWATVEIEGDNVSESHCEYWARGNEYFRLDSFQVVDGRRIGKINRIIVTPNRFVSITANSTDDPGGIYDVGSLEEGIHQATGRFFIDHASRVATMRVTDWIQHWKAGTYEIKDFEIDQDNVGGIVLTITRMRKPGTQSYRVKMSPEDFRVLSWQYIFDSRDGGQHAEQNVVLDYDADQKVIPRSEKSTTNSNFGPMSIQECELIDFDLKPAPLHLFALPDINSPKSSWRLKLALLSFGLLCLAAYYSLSRREA